MFKNISGLFSGLIEGDSQKVADALARESETQEKREKREAEIASWRKDYLDNSIPPHMYVCYHDCPVCGKLVWNTSDILGMCPLCVIALPEFVLDLTFGHSKSKKYRTALKRARAISTYNKVGEVHTIHFDTLGEFSDQRHAVHALILVIFRWVSTKVSLNGKQVTTDGISSLVYEIDRLRDNAGAADIAFNDGVIIYTPKPEPDWDEGCVYPKETITVEPVKDDGMGNLLPEGIESSAAPL